MKPSKYLEAINGASKTAGETYELYGDAILVEVPPMEEIKRKSGIIVEIETKPQLGSMSADRPYFVHVLAVGKGYYKEDGTDVPVSVQPGDIILVGIQSVKRFSNFGLDNYDPFSIGLTRESEIQIRFKGLDGYLKYFEAVNAGLAAPNG